MGSLFSSSSAMFSFPFVPPAPPKGIALQLVAHGTKKPVDESLWKCRGIWWSLKENENLFYCFLLPSLCCVFCFVFFFLRTDQILAVEIPFSFLVISLQGTVCVWGQCSLLTQQVWI